jgi:hypothetical protein
VEGGGGLMGGFNVNEISLTVLVVIAYGIYFLLPKRFTRQIRMLSFMWGFATGVLIDFTIGGGLIDLYMENDTNAYEIFDFVYYLLYAPFGYFFFHFYDVFHINRKRFIFYIIGWSIIGLSAQWLFTALHILSFQKGYKLIYSFPIFLLTQTLTGYFYRYIMSKERAAQDR